MRFARANANFERGCFAYFKYDVSGRLTEKGLLKAQEAHSLDEYRSLANERDYPSTSQSWWKKRYTYDRDGNGDSVNLKGRLYKVESNDNPVFSLGQGCHQDNTAGTTSNSYKYDFRGQTEVTSLITSDYEEGAREGGKDPALSVTSVRNTGYVHNNQGRTTSVIYPTAEKKNAPLFDVSEQIANHYLTNPIGQLAHICREPDCSGDSGYLTNYKYDINGLRVSHRINTDDGVLQTRKYDFQTRLASIQLDSAAEGNNPALFKERLAYQSGSTGAGYQAGYIVRTEFTGTLLEESGSHSYDYDYDVFGRLVRATRNAGSQFDGERKTFEYAYDPNGNMTSKSVITVTGGDTTTETDTFTYEFGNRLHQVTGSDGSIREFDYSETGAVTVDVVDLATRRFRAYDRELSSDRIYRAETNNHTLYYRYDALGNRIGEIIDNKTHDGVLLAEDDNYYIQSGNALSTIGSDLPGVIDNDLPSDGVEVLLVSYPSHGYLDLYTDGTFTYYATRGDTGAGAYSDSFTYRLHKGDTYSNVATVTIEVPEELTEGVAPTPADTSPPIPNGGRAVLHYPEKSPSEPYSVGETIVYALAFNKDVVVLEPWPRLGIMIGDNLRWMDYIDPGSTNLIEGLLELGYNIAYPQVVAFEYTIQPDDAAAGDVRITASDFENYESIVNLSGVPMGTDYITQQFIENLSLLTDDPMSDNPAVRQPATGAEVRRISFKGDPGNSWGYGPGESIHVEYEFNKIVEVTGEGDGPSIPLRIGDQTVAANYNPELSAWRKLVFSYMVQPGDRGLVNTLHDRRWLEGTERVRNLLGMEIADTENLGAPPLARRAESLRSDPVDNVTTYRTAQQVTVTWDLPAADGNAPITGYEVRIKRGTQDNLEDPTSVDTRSSLVYEHRWTPNTGTPSYQVRAVNVFGPGAWSDEVATAPPDYHHHIADTRITGAGTLEAHEDWYRTLGSWRHQVPPELGVLANDRVQTPRGVRAVLDATTSNGSLVLGWDGSFSYEPNGGYSGPDQFTYHMEDDDGNSSQAVTAVIYVDPADPSKGLRAAPRSEDTTSPRVTNLAVTSSPMTGDHYQPGEVIEATLTISEDVALGNGLPPMLRGNFAKTNQQTLGEVLDPRFRNMFYNPEKSGPRRLVFEFTVPDGITDHIGAVVVPEMLFLDDPSVAHPPKGSPNVFDLAGNPIHAIFWDLFGGTINPEGYTWVNHKVGDTAAPSVDHVEFLTRPANWVQYLPGETIAFLHVYDEPVIADGQYPPEANLLLGSGNRTATYDAALTASDGRSKVIAFSYVVQEDDYARLVGDPQINSAGQVTIAVEPIATYHAISVTDYSGNEHDPSTASFTEVSAYYAGDILPAAPPGFTAMRGSLTDSTLRWSPPVSDGNRAIEGYEIQVRAPGAEAFGETIPVPGRTTLEYTASPSAPPGTAYRVRASSKMGDDRWRGKWSEEAFLGPSTFNLLQLKIAGLRAKPATSGPGLELSWVLSDYSDYGYGDVDEYVIERLELDADHLVVSKEVMLLLEDETTYSDHGLDPNTAYSYRVSARYPMTELSDPQLEHRPEGYSFPSTVSATTLNYPGKVQSARARLATDASEVGLTWHPPADNGGRPVSGYKLVRSGTHRSGNYCPCDAEFTTPTGSYTDTGVTGVGWTYRYQIIAINSVGEGQPSDPVSVTMPREPDQVPARRSRDPLRSPDGTGLTVRWEVPYDGGSPITGYFVERTSGGKVTWTIGPDSEGSWITLVDSGLQPNTSYEYDVRAQNIFGNSLAEQDVGAGYTLARPYPARRFTAAPGSDGSVVTLTWVRPLGDAKDTSILPYASHPVTQYELHRWTGNSADGEPGDTVVFGRATSFHDYHVSPGATYTYKIRAVNGVGVGSWSSPITATTPGLPARVMSLTVTPVPVTNGEHGQMGLTWSKPGDGGSSIKSYQIRRTWTTTDQLDPNEERTNTAHYISTETSYADSNVEGDRAYTYQVRAANGVGFGEWSETVEARSLNAPPGAVNLVQEFPSSDGTQMTLRWVSPHDGGEPIEEYEVQRSVGDGEFATLGKTPALGDSNLYNTYLDTGLDPGAVPTYRIRAINELGAGRWSTKISFPQLGLTEAEPTPPGPVGGVKATAVPDGSGIKLTWKAPQVGGPVESYDVQREDSSSRRITITALNSSLSDIGLEAGATYTYRVRARNSEGVSAWSDPVSTTVHVGYTPIAVVPTLVTSLAAEITAPGNTITLTWAVPDSGDSQTTLYEIDRDTGSGPITVLGSATNSYRDEGLTPGLTYYYTVRARTAGGSGPMSSTVSATVPTALPAKPSNFSAGQTGGGQATLTWDSPGDVTISGYQYSQDGGATWSDFGVSGAGTVHYILTGLTPGQTYGFSVRAQNYNGAGEMSDSVSLVLAPLPNAPTGFALARGNQQVTMIWDDPGDETITGYEYWVRRDAGDEAIIINWEAVPGSDAATKSFTAAGLTNGEAYRFRVRAHNAAGDGDKSPVESATPGLVPNHQPTFNEGAQTLRSVDEGAIPGTHVGASVEATDGDNDILSFSLSSEGTDHEPFAIDGDAQIMLRSGHTLDYSVRSSYSVTVGVSDGRDSDGNFDSEVDAYIVVTILVTNVDDPGQVGFGSLQPRIGAPLTATLTDPDGPISNTIWQWASSADGSVWTDVPGTGSTSYTPVANDLGAYLRATVNYEDSHGPGKSAQGLTANPVQQALDRPTGLSVVSGDSDVTLRWTYPGDPTITGYEYTTNPADGEPVWTAVPFSGAATTSYTVTGLTNGVTYTFAIRAVRSGDPGVASESVGATPNAPGVSISPAGPVTLVEGAPAQAFTVNAVNLLSSNHQIVGTFMDGASVGDLSFQDREGQMLPVSVTGTEFRVALGAIGPENFIYSFAVSATEDNVVETGERVSLQLVAHDTSENVLASSDVVEVDIHDPETNMVPAAPTGLTATAGDGQVSLAWDNLSDSTITGFQYNQDDGANWLDIVPSDATTVQHVVTGLTDGQSYDFALRAVNPVGPGPASDSVPITLGPLPAAPTGFTATAGDGQVTLAWDSPSDVSITGFQYTQDDGANWLDIVPSDATTVQHVVTGLTPGESYDFALRGVNPVGPGPASDSVPITLGPLPAAPTGFTATAGDGQVTLAWDSPSDVSITGFQYTQDDGANWLDIVPSDATTVQHVVTGLTPGESYNFALRGVNPVGPGPASDSVPITLGPLPAAPTGFTATAGDGQVTLAWDSPSDVSITGFQYTQDDGANWLDIVPSDATTVQHVVTGLTDGQSYDFALRGANPVGPGPASDSVPITLGPLPAAPTGFTATAGDGQVTLAWDSPSDVSITGFQYTQDDGANWLDIVPSDATTVQHVVTGLTPGESYDFAVRGVNSLGAGAASATVSLILETLPVAPTGLTATARDGEVTLTWDESSDVTITGYKYRIREHTGDKAVLVRWDVIPGSSTNTSSFTATGLTNGKAYRFRVRSFNAVGGQSTLRGGLRGA